MAFSPAIDLVYLIECQTAITALNHISFSAWKYKFNSTKNAQLTVEKRETLQQLPEINEKATYWLLPLINAVFKGYT